jgi:hypothetical protein
VEILASNIAEVNHGICHLHIDLSDDNIFMGSDHRPSLQGSVVCKWHVYSPAAFDQFGTLQPAERFNVEMITKQHNSRASSVREALVEWSRKAGCQTIIQNIDNVVRLLYHPFVKNW